MTVAAVEMLSVSCAKVAAPFTQEMLDQVAMTAVVRALFVNSVCVHY